MDIRPYINSKAIAEHFYKEFDEKKDIQAALKYSWLVWESRNKTFEQKHEAWEEIINTMPDQAIEARRLLSRQESLHDFLRRYMNVENALRDMFHAKDKNCVYQYETQERAVISNFDHVYSTYESCCAAVKEYIDDDDYVENIFVRKRWLDNEEKQIIMTLSPKDFSEKRIHNYGVLEEREAGILDGFAAMWLIFPTPFKHGDLLQITYGYYKESLFLLDYICTDMKFFKKHENLLRGYRDSSDMTAYGYVLTDGCPPIYDVCQSYLDLEFYNCEYNKGR